MRDALDIVADIVLGVAVLADIGADDAALAAARPKPRRHRRQALAVEAEAVDERLVLDQAEEPRRRIAGLRPRRHRADLDEAEAEAQHRVGHLGMLVEAGGEPDRVGKLAPPQA